MIRKLTIGVAAVLALAAGTVQAKGTFTLHSADFANGAAIPAAHEGNAFGCAGRNVPPSLSWRHAPQGTSSFALLLTDPDAPGGTFTHWVVYNIGASRTSIGPTSLAGVTQGKNDVPGRGYVGPCPPPGSAHHYHFTLYALNVAHIGGVLSRSGLRHAIKGHVLATAALIGTFGR